MLQETTLTIDEIAVLSDDDLYSGMRDLHNEITKSRKVQVDSTDLEINFCYYSREAKIREMRRHVAAQFMQTAN